PTTCLTVPLICFADPTTRSLSIVVSSDTQSLNGRGGKLRREWVVVVDLNQQYSAVTGSNRKSALISASVEAIRCKAIECFSMLALAVSLRRVFMNVVWKS